MGCCVTGERKLKEPRPEPQAQANPPQPPQRQPSRTQEDEPKLNNKAPAEHKQSPPASTEAAAPLEPPATGQKNEKQVSERQDSVQSIKDFFSSMHAEKGNSGRQMEYTRMTKKRIQIPIN